MVKCHDRKISKWSGSYSNVEKFPIQMIKLKKKAFNHVNYTFVNVKKAVMIL